MTSVLPTALLAALWLSSPEIVPVVPESTQMNAPFSDDDILAFRRPAKVHYPQTWFHFIDGNVGREGITADLEAIAGAGISGELSAKVPIRNRIQTHTSDWSLSWTSPPI